MGQRICEACGARNKLAASVCAGCGATLRRSRQDAGGKGPAQGMGIFYRFLDLFPGLAHPRTLLCVVVMLVAAAGVGRLALWYLEFHALPATLLVGVVAMLIYCTAITWVLYGYVCLPSEAVVEFDTLRWLLLIGLALVPIAVVSALGG